MRETPPLEATGCSQRTQRIVELALKPVATSPQDPSDAGWQWMLNDIADELEAEAKRIEERELPT